MDVNVSPAKTQVRFADAGTAYRLVYHALFSALLSGKEERRLRSGPAPTHARARRIASEPYGEGARGHTARRRPRACRRRRSAPRSAPPAEKRLRRSCAIGQHRESYILASGPEGLLVIDQHAAHERILYERIRDRIASGRVLSQRLLMRALFEATPEEAETLAARLRGPVGGRIRDRADVGPLLGDRGAAGRGHGPRARRKRCDEVARAPGARPAAGDPTSGATGWPRASPAAPRSRSATTWRPRRSGACSRDWSKTADRFTCPHGRPVVLSMTEEELEKYFKRR